MREIFNVLETEGHLEGACLKDVMRERSINPSKDIHAYLDLFKTELGPVHWYLRSDPTSKVDLSIRIRCVENPDQKRFLLFYCLANMDELIFLDEVRLDLNHREEQWVANLVKLLQGEAVPMNVKNVRWGIQSIDPDPSIQETWVLDGLRQGKRGMDLC